MAQIVCIDIGTVNIGICELGDIVSIHDDDVALTGSGYINYKVIKVEGKTVKELRAALTLPEQKTAVKIPEANKWSFMEEKSVWKNSVDKWCELVKMPKYSHTTKDLTAADLTTLSDKLSLSTEKDSSIAKIKNKIHLDSANNIEVADLNVAKV